MSNKYLNIAVIGASGALGGEFVKQLSDRQDVQSIFAFSRSKVDFDDSKIESHFIEIEDEVSIKEAASKISEKLDVVIIATGMLHDEEISPEKSLAKQPRSIQSSLTEVSLLTR